MMKRWLLVSLILLASLFLANCGIPQDAYNAVIAERDTAKAQATSLQNELNDSKSALDTANNELTQVRGSLADTKDDLNKAQFQIRTLQSDYDAAITELAYISEVYPARDFHSFGELRDWLSYNDVSEQPLTQYAESWYAKALEIQEDALIDGYIISADYDSDYEDNVWVTCVTIINGDTWYWDPETDEPFQDYTLGKVK